MLHINRTKYSGGLECDPQNIEYDQKCWQLKNKTLAGKELRIKVHFWP